MKILLVENKDLYVDVLMSIIADASKQIKTCRTVAEAEAMLRTFAADVVVIDQELFRSINLSSTLLEELRNVELVIVASDEYMKLAYQWGSPSGKEIWADALNMAAGRKNVIERIEHILRRMKNRTDQAQEVADSIHLESPDRPRPPNPGPGPTS